MAGHGEKMSRKQEAAIESLLTCRSIRRAAAHCGISDRTLRNWLADPSFAAAYAAARRQLLGHAIGRLNRASGKAVGRLVRALSAAKDTDAIRAALGVIDRAIAGGELLDVLDRLDRLERLASKVDKK